MGTTDNKANKAHFFQGAVKNAFIRHECSRVSESENRKGSHNFDVIALICEQEKTGNTLQIVDKHIVRYDVKFVPRNPELFPDNLDIEWSTATKTSRKDGVKVFLFNKNLLKGHPLLSTIYAEIAFGIENFHNLTVTKHNPHTRTYEAVNAGQLFITEEEILNPKTVTDAEVVRFGERNQTKYEQYLKRFLPKAVAYSEKNPDLTISQLIDTVYGVEHLDKCAVLLQSTVNKEGVILPVYRFTPADTEGVL